MGWGSGPRGPTRGPPRGPRPRDRSGYDAGRDAFRVLDPARPTAEPQLVAAADVHAARMSHGTDEDLIIVPWAQPALSGRGGAKAARAGPKAGASPSAAA